MESTVNLKNMMFNKKKFLHSIIICRNEAHVVLRAMHGWPGGELSTAVGTAWQGCGPGQAALSAGLSFFFSPHLHTHQRCSEGSFIAMEIKKKKNKTPLAKPTSRTTLNKTSFPPQQDKERKISDIQLIIRFKENNRGGFGWPSLLFAKIVSFVWWISRLELCGTLREVEDMDHMFVRKGLSRHGWWSMCLLMSIDHWCLAWWCIDGETHGYWSGKVLGQPKLIKLKVIVGRVQTFVDLIIYCGPCHVGATCQAPRPSTALIGHGSGRTLLGLGILPDGQP